MLLGMAYTIPDSEPSVLRAGDTATWTRLLADYPATDGWVLGYRLINADGNIDISSTASGAAHLVNVAPDTTAGWLPGEYRWVSSVTLAGARHTIAAGQIKILPDLAAETGGYDDRSPARKALAAIDAALVAHGANAWTQEYEIAGRSMKFRSVAEFYELRKRLQAECRAEDNADRISRGLGSKNKILVRL